MPVRMEPNGEDWVFGGDNGGEILAARERLKEQTLRRRRRINRGLLITPEEEILPALYRSDVSLVPEGDLCHLG